MEDKRRHENMREEERMGMDGQLREEKRRDENMKERGEDARKGR